MSPAVAAPDARVVDISGPVPESIIDRLAGPGCGDAVQRWRGFGPGVSERLLRWELQHGHEDAGAHWRLLAEGPGGAIGLAWVAGRSWESEQLGIAMGTIRRLITVGPAGEPDGALAITLLDAVEDRLGREFACVSCRADAEDVVTIHALQQRGYRLVDTSVSFLCGREILPFLARRIPQRCATRAAQVDDAEAIEDIARVTRFGGRFYRDPRIDRAAADRLYRAWVRACHARTFADGMAVAVRRERVVGFLAYQFQRDLERAAGIRLAGRGLLAVAPDHPGVALDVVRAAIEQASAWADFGQFDIHVENAPLLGLYGRALRMDPAGVQHTFHRWLDEPRLGAP